MLESYLVDAVLRAGTRAERYHRRFPAMPPLLPGHFVDSLAFVDAKDWARYRREQELITAGVERMKTRASYYGSYPVSFSTLN